MALKVRSTNRSLSSLMQMFLALTSAAALAGSPGPSISRIYPNAANIAGGTSVVIYGSGFTSVQSVQIGARTAAVIRSSDAYLFAEDLADAFDALADAHRREPSAARAARAEARAALLEIPEVARSEAVQNRLKAYSLKPTAP